MKIQVNTAITCLLLLLASGCASNDRHKASDALTAPLSDLNLMKVDIPPILQEAVNAPYALPELASCENLVQRVLDLNTVLGPDVDADQADDQANDQDWLAKGSEEAKDAAIGAIHDTTTAVIPFRGWVRKLSGAERHAKNVAAAISAGSLQRAYYKGAIQSLGCS